VYSIDMEKKQDYMLGNVETTADEAVTVWIAKGKINLDTTDCGGDIYLTPDQATELTFLLNKAIVEAQADEEIIVVTPEEVEKALAFNKE